MSTVGEGTRSWTGRKSKFGAKECRRCDLPLVPALGPKTWAVTPFEYRATFKTAETLDFRPAGSRWDSCEVWSAACSSPWGCLRPAGLLPALQMLPGSFCFRHFSQLLSQRGQEGSPLLLVPESLSRELELWEHDAWPAGSFTLGPLPVFPVLLPSSAALPATLRPHQTLSFPNTKRPLELCATLCVTFPHSLLNTPLSCCVNLGPCQEREGILEMGN